MTGFIEILTKQGALKSVVQQLYQLLEEVYVSFVAVNVHTTAIGSFP